MRDRRCGTDEITTAGIRAVFQDYVGVISSVPHLQTWWGSPRLHALSRERWAGLFNFPKWTAFIELTLFANERWA
jgi:hypothetical protein